MTMGIVPSLHEVVIGPTDQENPRNGEGAIIPLQDGRLLLGWGRFTGGQDHSPAEIWGRISEDDGYTWGRPYLLQENIGECNVMSVGFLRLASGELLFGFGIKHHESQDTRYYVRRSGDDGLMWGDPVLTMPEKGYFVVNNDRLLQHSSGRILIPAAKAVTERYHCISGCFYSDDGGETWQRSVEFIDLPGGPVGLQEPGIVECADNSLWMWMRTDKGSIYASRSSDAGETWSDPEPTDLVAPTSPASAKRLPGSDDILIIYNDRRGVPLSSDWSSEFNWRTPLNSAVSADNGRTWQHHRLIESDESHSYCYTSITFHQESTLLTYYVGKAGGPNLLDMKLKIVRTSAWTDA